MALTREEKTHVPFAWIHAEARTKAEGFSRVVGVIIIIHCTGACWQAETVDCPLSPKGVKL